ncbi:MAG TPA: hypothetical protein VEA35_06650 [Ramlibacter sp.]|nr:hypothetical protein [Ramlibacter sp.]
MSEAAARVEGPAFPLLVKLLAVALVGAMLAWAARTAVPLLQADWTWGAAAVMVLAVVMVLWCLAWILRSRTEVDADTIRQTWMWPKEVKLADVTQARLVGVPGLHWLIAPRLVVRARGRGLLVFHVADPRVLTAVARVCLGSSPLLQKQ